MDNLKNASTQFWSIILILRFPKEPKERPHRKMILDRYMSVMNDLARWLLSKRYSEYPGTSFNVFQGYQSEE